jgi:hypothetical protein
MSDVIWHPNFRSYDIINDVPGDPSIPIDPIPRMIYTIARAARDNPTVINVSAGLNWREIKGMNTPPVDNSADTLWVRDFVDYFMTEMSFLLTDSTLGRFPSSSSRPETTVSMRSGMGLPRSRTRRFRTFQVAWRSVSWWSMV